jgi:hypothetical protein
MSIDNSEERNKRYANMRAIKDYGMGLLYYAIGFFMFFPEQVGFDMVDFDKLFRYMFGGISVIYGTWRIYRGYKKDYFR